MPARAQGHLELSDQEPHRGAANGRFYTGSRALVMILATSRLACVLGSVAGNASRIGKRVETLLARGAKRAKGASKVMRARGAGSD